MEILYKLLTDDEVLKQLLGATVRDSRIYPLKNERGDKSVTYNYVLLTSDKIKEQARLEIRVFVKDILKGNKILDRIKELLLTFGDTPLTDSILRVDINGGITPTYDADSCLYTIGIFFNIIKIY